MLRRINTKIWKQKTTGSKQLDENNYLLLAASFTASMLEDEGFQKSENLKHKAASLH